MPEEGVPVVPAARVKIDPRIGPIHGDQLAAKEDPMRIDPRYATVSPRCTGTLYVRCNRGICTIPSEKSPKRMRNNPASRIRETLYSQKSCETNPNDAPKSKKTLVNPQIKSSVCNKILLRAAGIGETSS